MIASPMSAGRFAEQPASASRQMPREPGAGPWSAGRAERRRRGRHQEYRIRGLMKA